MLFRHCSIQQLLGKSKNIFLPARYLRSSAIIQSKDVKGPKSNNTQANKPNPKLGTLVFESPLSSRIWRLKLVSLTSCTASCTASPFMAMGGVDMTISGQYMSSVFLLMIGISTTSVLTWCTRSFVHKVFRNKDNVYTLELLNIFTRKTYDSFTVEQITTPNKILPFVNFGLDTGKDYMLHARGEDLLNDPVLLEALQEVNTSGQFDIVEEDTEGDHVGNK